jgi:hypothetical protein
LAKKALPLTVTGGVLALLTAARLVSDEAKVVGTSEDASSRAAEAFMVTDGDWQGDGAGKGGGRLKRRLERIQARVRRRRSNGQQETRAAAKGSGGEENER